MKILVVDDDDLLGRGLIRMLRGHDVIVEPDAAAALERVHSGERFDLILCDLQMPSMSGPEVFADVRRHLGAGSPILILMTGHHDADRGNADAMLCKPFSRSALNAALISNTNCSDAPRRAS
jgi:CheY-like chemotaxis protein